MAGSAQQQDKISVGAAEEMPSQNGDLPIELGQGYDIVSGVGRNTAAMIEFGSSGANSTVHYSVCQSITEVLEAFEIEQSLTGGLLNIGSVSEKVSFVRSQKVTSTSVSIAIYCKHIEITESVTNAILKNDVQPPSSNKELADFFLLYGDCYLSARTLGGEYCALYLYSTETRQEQSSLLVDMKAAGIFGGGSVEASLGTKINNFNSTTKVIVTSDQKITGILNPSFPKPTDMIDFALHFPSLPLTGAVITNFATSGYEHLPGIGSAFQPIAQNRHLVAEDPLFIAKLGQLVELQNAIASVKSIYTFYGGYQDANLEGVEADANADKQAVVDMMNKYTGNPIATVVQPLLKSIENGSPALSFSEHEEVCGVGGAPQFNDVPYVHDYVLKQTRITEIQLGPGGVINWIKTTYSDGQTSTHGGSGGDFRYPAKLAVGTFVKSVSGFLGWGNKNTYCIATLSIMLSDGSEVPRGSLNHSGDGAFDWTVPDNSVVVGFRGRSGWFLDQLRIVYVTFNSATWTK